jgi:hypothetical protein
MILRTFKNVSALFESVTIMALPPKDPNDERRRR